MSFDLVQAAGLITASSALSAAVTGLVGKVQGWRSQAGLATDLLIQRLSNEIDRVSLRVDACEEKHDECEARCDELNAKVRGFLATSSVATYPHQGVAE